MGSYRDLRDWLRKLEEIEELKVIQEEVDWNEELTAVTYMAAKEKGSPALIFEKIKGYPKGYRVLSNILGSSLRRIALTMGLPLDLSALEMIRRTKDIYKKPIPPEIIAKGEAPVNENLVMGEDVNLDTFPAPKMWPRDGGRYIGTGDVVITKDPDDGHLNVGTYRQMIHTLHREKYWKRGEPCEVAVAYGIDPGIFVVGSMGFPRNVSEFPYAGGLKGEPVRLVKGEVTDLLIPADAEIVVEGLSYPDKYKTEGPFGEFQGYYGRPGGATPYIEVKCIHYRNDPILMAALMADHPSCEQNLFFGIARSAYSVPAAAGGFGMIVVSIEQKHAGHAAQVAALAAQCPGGAYNSKWIIVVDEDVDPTDLDQVLWAMCTRCHPPDDIDILRNTWSTYLDPTRNPPEDRPYGAKTLINACKEHKYLDSFSKRTLLRESVYKKVKEKWGKFGFDFPPPELKNFEPDE
jgi:4-hydroxy-3-polyprenylbenzoate decarboxylase